jgi:alkaline phosphatase
MQDKIASRYLDLRFDVMMGGGSEYFDGTKREDKRNIFKDFTSAGFQLVRNKEEMLKAVAGKPVMGVFHEDGLPYSLDQENDATLSAQIPSLTEMTRKSLELMSNSNEGFVLLVEGGKVDWAAHGNDTPALLYDQIAFDKAVFEALEFAGKRNDTLVIISTDHGNANPGLIKHDKVNQRFDHLQAPKHSNEWILNGTLKNHSASHLIERINYAQGITISHAEAASILKTYETLDDPGLYNAYKLPFKQLAEIQQNYTSVHWSGMNHSSDFVELTMYGPGSEALPNFIYNYELHNYMLEVTGVEVKS